jgi:hypothetical protein
MASDTGCAGTGVDIPGNARERNPREAGQLPLLQK